MASLPTVRCFEKTLPGKEPCILAKQSRGFYLWQVQGSGRLFTGILLQNVKEGSVPVFSGNFGLQPGSNRGKKNPWKNRVATWGEVPPGVGGYLLGKMEDLPAYCSPSSCCGSVALSNDALTSLSCGVCSAGHQMWNGRRFRLPHALRTAPVLGLVLKEGRQARRPPSLPTAPVSQSRGTWRLIGICFYSYALCMNVCHGLSAAAPKGARLSF